MGVAEMQPDFTFIPRLCPTGSSLAKPNWGPESKRIHRDGTSSEIILQGQGASWRQQERHIGGARENKDTKKRAWMHNEGFSISIYQWISEYEVHLTSQHTLTIHKKHKHKCLFYSILFYSMLYFSMLIVTH
jgi:hypothetical protein